MKIFKRFMAKTPLINKRIGRILTSISAALTVLEAHLLSNNINVPKWLHAIIITSTAITAIWAAYHGQKVKR